MKTAGYRASRAVQTLIGRSPHASEYYVVWLAILPEGHDPDEVTPFYFLSEDLCGLVPFLQLACQIPPSLHGFSQNFHRYNHSAMTMNRFGHWIITCYQRNFNSTFITSLDGHLAKVIYIQNRCAPGILSQLAAYRVSPIVLCDEARTFDACLDAGLQATMLQDAKPADLVATIGRLFSTPLEKLRELGFDEKQMLPASFVAEHPGSYNFGESNLMKYPVTGLRFLEPNETLVNVIRRRVCPERPDLPPARDKSVDLMVSSSEIAFAHMLVDYLLFQEGNDPDPDLDSALRAAMELYRNSHAPDAYESLVQLARAHLGSYPGVQTFIFCCPAVHRESIESFLHRRIPSRLLKYLFKKKTDDYLTWIETKDLKSEDDRPLLAGLMQYAAMENAYISTVLTLYALAARCPVVRTPQLSSSLFGLLRQIHQSHRSRNARAVVKQIAAFSEQLRSEMPTLLLDFLRMHPGPHLTVVSDLPLEWVMSEDVPLMFQREINRIPIRPGNGLLIHFDEAKATLHLGWEEAANVLILDCTKEGEEVGVRSLVLHDALTSLGFKSKYHRPSTVEEYKEVLKAAAPYILVHWGHGFYDTREDRGYLRVRDESTEVWDWRGVAVPPIVMLGACETSALAQTHNNPANAWLAIGARAVFATLLPVDADLTCVLYTRIFANLHEALRGKQMLRNWSTVVSKTIFLQRYLDFFYGYRDWRQKKGLTPVPPEFYFEYTYRWNRRIISLADGYRRCPSIVRETLAFFGEEFAIEFDEYLELDTVMPHTMFFTHLGSPETILLMKREASPGRESEAHDYWRKRDTEGVS